MIKNISSLRDAFHDMLNLVVRNLFLSSTVLLFYGLHLFLLWFIAVSSCRETRMIRLSNGEEIMTLAFFVLMQYWSVTDGWTDRRTCLLWLYQRLHSLLC